jgi:Cu(I)/Ag(I) efflux system membrane fusion protein
MTSPGPTPAPARARLRVLARAAGLLLARSRFLLLIAAVLLAVGGWPVLQNYWDMWTRSARKSDAISAGTEYWCPMCPGVVSDWPGKCPVCHMDLIRRQKGEMTPLPDGVVARVQLSPYRIQLAGIRTVPVEYRALKFEVTAAGLTELVESSLAGVPPRFHVRAELTERDAALLAAGQEAAISRDDFPGEPFPGRLVALQPLTPPRRGASARVEVDDPRRRLRPGQYVSAAFRTPVASSETERRLAVERWRDRVAFGGGTEERLAALIEAGVSLALRQRGLALAIPESAVIDTGERKIVFVEGMRGEFDAVVVTLGRRCGDFYPVRAGLDPGQRVVAVGAVLLDAQTRLNPGAATAYFGAASRPASTAPAAPSPGGLSPEERVLAERQKICPVTKQPLDSMGGPVPLLVSGRKVFVCCEGCEAPLRKSPAKYLANLPR